jgi:hypothetical protein
MHSIYCNTKNVYRKAIQVKDNTISAEIEIANDSYLKMAVVLFDGVVLSHGKPMPRPSTPPDTPPPQGQQAAEVQPKLPGRIEPASF